MVYEIKNKKETIFFSFSNHSLMDYLIFFFFFFFFLNNMDDYFTK